MELKFSCISIARPKFKRWRREEFIEQTNIIRIATASSKIKEAKESYDSYDSYKQIPQQVQFLPSEKVCG